MEEIFEYGPLFGFRTNIDSESFNDLDLFDQQVMKFPVLKKIKIWYGTSITQDIEIKEKIILGIECEYIDSIAKNEIITETHCGDLLSDDIEIKELELKKNDYVCQINLDFEEDVITYLKFKTKQNKIMEIGIAKKIRHSFFNNDNKDKMINFIFGEYHAYGLTAFGFIYISRIKFISKNLYGFFILKHILRNNKEEKKKWDNPKEIKKLPLDMQIIVKLCNLEDRLFNRIIQYYFPF